MVNLFNKDLRVVNSTAQLVRKNMISELEGIMGYEETLLSTTDTVTRRMIEDIRNEELVHLGNLLALLNYINPGQKQYIEEGIREFNSILTGNQSSQMPSGNSNQTTPLM